MTNDLVSCPCSGPYDPLVVIMLYLNGQSIVSNLYAMKMLEESRVACLMSASAIYTDREH
jgi:hypothetical protein